MQKFGGKNLLHYRFLKMGEVGGGISSLASDSCVKIDLMMIEEMTLSDYEEVYELWKTSPGVGLSDADSIDGIGKMFERNPGMSFVARENGALAGAVLGSHDGRRGFVSHLAVLPDYRGKGVGRALVNACLVAFRSAGIKKCHIFVFKKNVDGQEFWKRLGWKERDDLIIMSAYTASEDDI